LIGYIIGGKENKMEEYMNALLVIFIFTFFILIVMIATQWSKKALYYTFEIGHYLYLTLAAIFIGYSFTTNNNFPISRGLFLLVISLVFKFGSGKMKEKTPNKKN